jgi:hypothetical protein
VKHHNWMRLSQAYEQLHEKFRGQYTLLDELLSDAITSGYVLVRGVPQFETLPVMIDGPSVKTPTKFDIRRGTLDLKSAYAGWSAADYHFVEIAWLEVDQYIHACAPRSAEAAVRDTLIPTPDQIELAIYGNDVMDLTSSGLRSI